MPTRLKPDESGIAMITAVLVMMLLTLIPLVTMGAAVQQLPLARHDQDRESALHAAEAGVQDYVNHLNANNNYWTYLNAPSDGNQAFTQWVQVPGTAANESFRYTVTSTLSQIQSQGIINIQASGSSCPGSSYTCSSGSRVVRTVQEGIRKAGFLNYLYFTDYEIVDPSLTSESSSCILHAWQYNSSTSGYGPNTSQCSVIFMTSSAVFNGPVHTNDGFYVCGNPTFNGPVDTYYNSPTSSNVTNSVKFGGAGALLNPSGCTNSPTFGVTSSSQPATGADLAMPTSQLPNLKTVGATTGTSGGCLFTGPTTIAIHYSGSTGYFDVTSKATKSINLTTCLTAASQLTTLAAGNTVTNLPFPANGVIYVQNIPSSTTDPNHSSCTGTACLGDVNVANATTNGGLAGQLTVASDDNITITGSLTYHNGLNGSDVLGLIAQNNVAVYHGITNGSNSSNDPTNYTIDAAILALQHSFYVQNWNQGNLLGTLNVYGSITQEYRGAVGTFSGSTAQTGYAKNYNYDTRLKYLEPPYFLSPTISAWSTVTFFEMAPAYS